MATSYTSPTWRSYRRVSFDGKAIRTIESHAKNGELSVPAESLHRALRIPVVDIAPPGFLNEGQVLLERLCKEKPVATRRAGEKPSRKPSTGHICRCTGYIKVP